MTLKQKKNIILIVVFLIASSLVELFIVRDFFNLSNAVAMDEKWRFEFLVYQGKDINEIKCRSWGDSNRSSCYTPLAVAVMNNNANFVARLLELGAKPDIPKSDRPIEYALYNNNTEIVDLLLKNGAKLVKSKMDLHSVMNTDNPYFVKFLINRQDIGPEELFCYTSDEYKIMKYLLETGIDPDIICKKNYIFATEYNITTTDSRRTKLFRVSLNDAFVGNNSAAITQLLIDYNADVNFKDDCNNTPLHFASKRGAKDVVVTLLENNATMGIKNCEGFTAYELAQNKKQKWVLKVFDEYNQSRR